jgi:predicted porin
MKAKALIPAALLLSLAGAANAQLVVYGLLDGSVGKSVADDIADKKADFHSGGDNGNSEGNSTSRFGLKGSTDVGSGIKANFNLQSNGITSNGDVNTPFFTRQAWFGFSGGLGEVRFGKQDSVGFQTLIDYDLNGWSNGVPASYMNLERGRQERSLQYISPSFGGAKVQVGFVPKGNQTAPNDKDVASVGVSFATGPLSVGVAVESKREEAAGTFFGAAGSYDLKVVKLALGATKDKTTAYGDVKLFSVGAVAPVAGINIGAQVGQASGDSKWTSAEFFINSEVFKNTTAYFEAGTTKFKKINNTDVDTKGTGFALGVIYVF